MLLHLYYQFDDDNDNPCYVVILHSKEEYTEVEISGIVLGKIRKDSEISLYQECNTIFIKYNGDTTTIIIKFKCTFISCGY